jgi:hypothetical protein
MKRTIAIRSPTSGFNRFEVEAAATARSNGLDALNTCRRSRRVSFFFPSLGLGVSLALNDALSPATLDRVAQQELDQPINAAQVVGGPTAQVVP